MFGAWSVKAPTPAWWLNRGGYCGGYWGGYGLPGYPYCPNIFVGGSCCSGCAEGKGCKGEEHPQAIIVGERALPFSKATELNAEAIKLSQNVGAWAVSKIGQFAPGESAASLASKFPNPGDGQFFLDFRTWKTAWDEFYAWRSANPPPWYIPVPPEAMTDRYTDLPRYEKLLGEYQALLERAKQGGVQTTAIVPDQGSLLEQTLEGGFAGAGAGLKKAGENIAEVASYVAVGAVAVAGLYFLGPPLVAVLSKRRKTA